jgi:hypothetical protein
MADLTSDERATLDAAATADDGSFWVSFPNWINQTGDYAVCEALHLRGLMRPEPGLMRFKITPAGRTLLQSSKE